MQAKDPFELSFVEVSAKEKTAVIIVVRLIAEDMVLHENIFKFFYVRMKGVATAIRGFRLPTLIP